MPKPDAPFLSLPHEGGICLSMIVKDEQDVIARCLRSVRPHIQSWCIVDTGSADNTEACAHDALKGIPGSFHHRGQDNFANMRNGAWDLALGHDPAYLMFLDADEELAIPGRIGTLEHDAYLIRVHHCGLISERYWLVRGDYPNRWEGRIHEDVAPHGAIARIPDTFIVSHLDGARAKDLQARNESDLRQLLLATQEEPENPRYWYYLGATYHLMGRRDKALAAFKRRVSMIPHDDEMYRRSEHFIRIYGGVTV